MVIIWLLYFDWLRWNYPYVCVCVLSHGDNIRDLYVPMGVIILWVWFW